ncbi:MAG: phosphoglycerate kinase [Xanthobacteraceae bacterium]|nr:phosphoglycerate kinase [Xanthobacteraceae bacterium]QYK44558.1 MAG: phosphoglycerate kinase [Xanthobacteraceae bacterium]
MSSFKTLDQADVKNKRVLVRVDLNVPMENGRVTDMTRIARVLPTIRELADKGAKVILLSHFGRPKGVDKSQSLEPLVNVLATALDRMVLFAPDCIGPDAEKAVSILQPGQTLVLENTRFHKGEEKNEPDFVAALARHGDVYVNDAFSAAHRAHASTEGLAHKMPAFAGRALQAELEALASALEKPERPVIAVAGGAKISTKLELLGNLLAKVDKLAIGGAMANTFLAAQGKPVGKSLFEKDLLDTARAIMEKAKANDCEIILPSDVVVAGEFKAHAPSKAISADKVGDGDMILDIGRESIGHIIAALASSKTLVWNGPFGAFEMEPFDMGTNEVAEAAAELTQAGKLRSVAGGGDTVAALEHAGAADRFTYISTAGGAFLEWLEGKTLPGVAALAVK